MTQDSPVSSLTKFILSYFGVLSTKKNIVCTVPLHLCHAKMHTSETLSPWRPFQLNLFYMWLCFRLYPLATMNCRILSEDIVLDGYLIPKEVKLHKWPKQVEIFVEMLLPVKSRPALRRCGVFPYLLSFFTSTDYRTICQYNKISRNVFWITSKINRLLSLVHNLCSVYSQVLWKSTHDFLSYFTNRQTKGDNNSTTTKGGTVIIMCGLVV